MRRCELNWLQSLVFTPGGHKNHQTFLGTGSLTCVEVLARFVLGVHGTVAHRRLHWALLLDDPGTSEELVDGRAKVGDLGGLQGPVVQLRLPHTLSKS